MAREVIPVAYVTKWARTRGIEIWEGGKINASGKFLLHPAFGHGSSAAIGPKHWTTDKAVAEGRWRQAVETEAKRLKLTAKKYEALSKGAPVYAVEEG